MPGNIKIKSATTNRCSNSLLRWNRIRQLHVENSMGFEGHPSLPGDPLAESTRRSRRCFHLLLFLPLLHVQHVTRAWLGICRVKRCIKLYKARYLVENPRGRLWELIITWCEQNSFFLVSHAHNSVGNARFASPNVATTPWHRGTFRVESDVSQDQQFARHHLFRRIWCLRECVAAALQQSQIWMNQKDKLQTKKDISAVLNKFEIHIHIYIYISIYKLMFVFETLRWPLLPHCLHQQVGTGGRS